MKFLESLKQKPPHVKKMIALSISAVIAVIAIGVSLWGIIYTTKYNKEQANNSAVQIKPKGAFQQIKESFSKMRSKVSDNVGGVKEDFSQIAEDIQESKTASSSTNTASSTGAPGTDTATSSPAGNE